MKTINVTFEDFEFIELTKQKNQKGKTTWRKFILKLIKDEKK